MYLDNWYKIPIQIIKLYRYSTIISNIYIFNSIKYAKSSGVYAKYKSYNKNLNVIIVELPSKQLKIFKENTIAILGRNYNKNKKKQFISKAGYLKLTSKRSIVRGVAMNPVDHPNGGRTKTNSPEKSIWGWIAKHNK